MEIIDTYLIKWFGPFSSREELKQWESNSALNFNLYLFQGKKKNSRSKYYCGMTYKQTVAKRMSNQNHHIHDFEGNDTELLQIWIGHIANKKPKEYDVRICENIITSELAYIEVGEKHLENRTNKKPPINDVYIIQEWWKKNEDPVMRRTKGSLPALVPEVMVYYSETSSLYGIDKLKFIGSL